MSLSYIHFLSKINLQKNFHTTQSKKLQISYVLLVETFSIFLSYFVNRIKRKCLRLRSIE